MKRIDVAALAASQGGEYVVGEKDLHTQTCYLVYGRLEAHEDNRLIMPGTGYEEILCVVHGRLLIHTNHGEMVLPEGNAVHVKENESFPVSNPNVEPAVYVIAGGRRNSQDAGPVPRGQ